MENRIFRYKSERDNYIKELDRLGYEYELFEYEDRINAYETETQYVVKIKGQLKTTDALIYYYKDTDNGREYLSGFNYNGCIFTKDYSKALKEVYDSQIINQFELKDQYPEIKTFVIDSKIKHN